MKIIDPKSDPFMQKWTKFKKVFYLLQFLFFSPEYESYIFSASI